MVRKWKYSFYDKDMKKIEKINLGQIWAGEEVSAEVWIKNEDVGLIRSMEFTPKDDDLEISGPNAMAPGEVAKVIVSWKAEYGREVGLKDLFRIRGVLEII